MMIKVGLEFVEGLLSSLLLCFECYCSLPCVVIYNGNDDHHTVKIINNVE